jgi:hypothetical protein
MKTLTSLFSISTLVVVILTLVITTVANADVHVRGYYRSNGTYVQPHWRSNPDGNFYNNWSTYPNVNPYTGTIGTRHTPSDSYGYSWRTPSYSYGYSSPYFRSYSSPSYNNFGSSLLLDE